MTHDEPGRARGATVTERPGRLGARARARRDGLPHRHRRADRGGGRRLPLPRECDWAGKLLAAPGRRCGHDRRGAAGSVGCGRVLRPRPVGARMHDDEVGRFRFRRRRFRRRLLRHHAPRSRGNGPAASDAARGCLGSTRTRRYPTGFPQRQPNRRDDGAVVVGLHDCQHRTPSRYRRLPEHRNPALRGGRPDLLPAGIARPGGRRGHRVLVVTGGDPPGLSEPAAARDRRRAGRRRATHLVAVHRDRAVQVVGAVADRSLQQLRRQRRRIRARRGLRCGGAQTVGRRAARPGPGTGGSPRFGNQPGRPLQRHDRTQRAGPARRDRLGAATRRRHRRQRPLCRNTRHRNNIGRSHRVRVAGDHVWPW
ncbi:hypothetical protein LAUMK7_02102 [Mycobacterium kansasii]|nr:hypothetical protein LAUMK40_02119 [Mycobacterium kansasii]VAZ73847.1 hypothetical protein LAUMK7_02102 [Mycobacterium kansasii]